ncbi:MAG: RES family NAD+ phosphorylase [Desulfobacterales bacterium]|nr:RES family NAD+ phosphorylase [Desulfobacterales bacterium]
MHVFRIAKTRHIKDLTGTGAKIYGGRWNHKGTGAIYTSENRSLATVEYLVHVPLSIVPGDLSIACLEIPDRIIPKQISIANLPRNWRDYPTPPALAELGTKWVLSNDSLLLRIPSVVVENEFNVLINPMHSDIHYVTISFIKKYAFNKRLFR